jgi:diguanylate cyclase (GGDEF)-like protein/PAS domain S-box-containing protein
MTIDPVLRTLLDRADARVIAFDSQGGNTVPLPTAWGRVAAATFPGDGPLDHVHPESHGLAVAAFERAKRQGSASTTIAIVDEQGEHQLEIFNLSETDDCFVAVATPCTVDQTANNNAAVLIPNQATYRLNATGVITAVGSEFVQMFGWTAEETIGKSSLDFIHPDDHENGIINWIEMLERPQKQVRLRQRLKTKTGEWVWCELTETNLLGQADTDCVTSQIVDVSREMAAQAALQEREQLLDRLSQALPTGVLQLSATGQVVIQNQRWSELIGSADTDGIAGLLERLVDPAPVKARIDDALTDGCDADLSVTFNTSTSNRATSNRVTSDSATFEAAGLCQFGELHIRPLQQNGDITGLLLTLDDVTRLQTHQLELADQARRDALTGVYNRLGIEELIEDRLKDGSVGDHGLTVLFVDLDKFKAVNDNFGHLVGDRVLQSIATCIQQHLRPQDRVGRIGGDEFLIILGPDSDLDNAAGLVRRITNALPAVASKFDEPVTIGVSIGVADGSRGDSFDSILKRADADMYRAKRQQPDRSRSDQR